MHQCYYVLVVQYLIFLLQKPYLKVINYDILVKQKYKEIYVNKRRRYFNQLKPALWSKLEKPLVSYLKLMKIILKQTHTHIISSTAYKNTDNT